MNKREYARLVEGVKRCGPEAILRAASSCDGHSIVKPHALVDAGLPPDVVAHLTRTYESDSSPKGTLFIDGRPVGQLTGVYGLDALRFLAGALGVEHRRAFGRGSEARNIRSALEHQLRKHDVTPAVPRATADHRPPA